MKSTLWNRKLFKSNNDSNTSLNSTHSNSHPTPSPLLSNPLFNSSSSCSHQNRSTTNSGSLNLTPTHPSSLIPTSSYSISSTPSATAATSPSPALSFTNTTTSPPKKQRGLFFGFQNSSVQSLLHLTFHSNSSDRDLSTPSSSTTSLKGLLPDPHASISKKEAMDSAVGTSSSSSRAPLMESTTIYYHPPAPKQEDRGEDNKLEGTDTKRGKNNKNGEVNRNHRDDPSEIGSSDQCRLQQKHQPPRKKQGCCGLCHHRQSNDRLLSLELFENVEELRQRRRDLGQLAAGRLSAPDIRNAASRSMAPTRQASPTPTHYSQQDYRSTSANLPTWYTKGQIQHHRRDCEYAQQLQRQQHQDKQQKHPKENEDGPGVIVSLVDWKAKQQQQDYQKRLLLDKQLPDLPGEGAVSKENKEKKPQRKRSQSAAPVPLKGLMGGLSGPQQPVAPPRRPPPPLPPSMFASGATSTHRTPSSLSIRPRIKVGHTTISSLSPPPLSALTSPPPTTPLPPTPTSKLQTSMLPSPLTSDRPAVFFPPPPPSTKPIVPTVDTSITCCSSTSTSPMTGESSIDSLAKVVDSLSDSVEALQRKIAMMLMLEEQANAAPGTTINVIGRESGTGKILPDVIMMGPTSTSTGTIASVGESPRLSKAPSSDIQRMGHGRVGALERRSSTEHYLISGAESQARRNNRVSTRWMAPRVSPDLLGDAEYVDSVAAGEIASGSTTSVTASLASSCPLPLTSLVPDGIVPPTPIPAPISKSHIPARPSRPDGSSQELKEALEVIDSRLVLLQYDWPRVPTSVPVSATLASTTTAAAAAGTTEPRAVAAPSAEISISPPSSASSTRSPSSSTFLRPPPPPSILTAPTTTPSGHLAPASPAPRSSASPLSQSIPYPFLPTSATSQFHFSPPPVLPLPSLPAPPPPLPTSQTRLGDKVSSSHAYELMRNSTHRCQTLDEELQFMVDRLQNELKQQYRRQQQRRRLLELEAAASASSPKTVATMTRTMTKEKRCSSMAMPAPARTTSLTLATLPPSQESHLEKSSSHRRRDYRKRGGLALITAAMDATAADSEDGDGNLLDCGPETRQLLDSIEEIRKRVLEFGRLGVGMHLGTNMDSSSSHSTTSCSSAYHSFDKHI